ncbi:hypothetical protein Pint_11382 [Pistacia integerrima]|uniref:Uncharacterized protein n=1 Tax=Pistacia integerrima TaxID=434235 RepID=A0ACC0XGQ8_9ROSI|nr:hypothetical protein Pint_11382 [Pistacia integerrima]
MFEPSVMCEPIDYRYTFRASELQDGDIVCFQNLIQLKVLNNVAIQMFLHFWTMCIIDGYTSMAVVHFRSLEKPKEDNFCPEM